MTNKTLIAINHESDILAARQAGRALAAELGFSNPEQILIATAISELARNIIEYARRGEVEIEAIENSGKRGILIVARDEGPGIPNIDLAMQDGYSTGRSLGLGLPGSRRLMDEFEIVSEVNKGTTVTIKKWKY